MKLVKFVLIVFFLQCTSALSEHSAERLFRASTLPYPPYQYIDTDTGTAKGLAIEVIDELFRRTGNGQVEYKFYPWKRAVHLTQSGNSDLLFNAGKNQARQAWGRYVDSVLILQRYNLFKRRDHSLFLSRDFRDAGDLSIAVRAGYLYGEGAFRQALDTEMFKSIHFSESTEQSVQMLLHGRVDLFVGDYLPVKHYLEENQLTSEIDRIQLDGEPMEVLRWPTYILLSRENTSEEIAQELYLEMEEMKRDGTYQAIVKRYRESL